MFFHKHKWEEIKIINITEPAWYGGQQWRDAPKCLITFQCKECKKYRQQKIEGNL